MNGLLNFGMKILDTHAEAIETEFAENFEMRAVRDAGVDFDAEFGIGCEREAFAREGEEVFDLFGREISRSATAPVKLHDRTGTRDGEADAIDFLF